MSAVADADEALVAQWSLLGRPPGAELHEERGITWFETPISHLPYNGVIEARLGDDPATDKAIGEVLQRFRRRGVQNLWFFPTTTTPDDLDRRVEAQGLRCVEQMTYMWLDLDDAPTVAAPDVEIVEVLDNEALDVYTALTVAYWEIPENERRLVADIQRALGPGTIPGHRFLAMADGRPLGKAYLSLAGPAEVASIYGMSVLPEARGRGVAVALSVALLERARTEGCHRVVLHSSAMAVGLYRRFGFVELCVRPVYASAEIWTGGH